MLAGSEISSLLMSSKASNQDREHRDLALKAPLAWGMLDPIFDNS